MDVEGMWWVVKISAQQNKAAGLAAQFVYVCGTKFTFVYTDHLTVKIFLVSCRADQNSKENDYEK